MFGKILLALVFSLTPRVAMAVVKPSIPIVPANAPKVIPLLKQELKDKWPTLTSTHTLAGQIEAETCTSLTNKRCWTPQAELRTSREQGVGFGQTTRTFDKNGKVNMDTMVEIKALDPSLKNWNWGTTLYDPVYQMRALVVYDRSIYNKFPSTIANEYEHLAFMLAAYNGGFGGTMSDRRLCAATKGCNPNLWFGHVENTSYKSKIKLPGYGQPFFYINRAYPKSILESRRLKYEPFFKDQAPK